MTRTQTRTQVHSFLLLVTIGLYSCNVVTGCIPADDKEIYTVIESSSGLPPVSEVTEDGRQISKGMNHMGFEIFQLIYQKYAADDPQKNLFTSPLSISTALGMTWNGAVGETEKEMREVLGYGELANADVLAAYQNLLSFLATNIEDVSVEYANSIWFDEFWQTKEEYIEQSIKYFDAAIGTISCNSPQAPKEINAWIEDKTHGLVEDMLDEKKPLPLQCIVLVNTLYFLADWAEDFDPSMTTQKQFTSANGETAKVPMMNRKLYTKYYENENIQAVSIPYKGNRFVWTGILPKNHYALSNLVEWLDGNEWDTITQSLGYEHCNLELPRFKIEFGTEKLNDYLVELGMIKAFKSGSDFSKMVEGPPPGISKVLHKTYIEVDEEGTEAAAATVVIMDSGVDGPAEESVNVLFDHPFIFIIHDTTTNTVLFHGQYNTPE